MKLPVLSLLVRLTFAGLVLATVSSGAAFAQMGEGATKADAERAVQAYLALWSHDGAVNAASVARFYAPHVVYYGKPMSRAQVLADKRAYIKAWPHRRYTEVPGSFSAECRPDRSRCTVSTIMAWRRVARDGRSSAGRARLRFEFVPADGGRKIARESAATF